MVKVKYISTSTVVRRANPIVKAPGKTMQNVISTGLYPSNKEFDYLKTMKLIKRGPRVKKKLKLIVPTMASSHWVTVLADWRCQLDQFTDPKSGDTQDVWAVEWLTFSTSSVECAMGYDLTATIKMLGQVQTMARGGVSFPKVGFQMDFESIGPTGAKVKTKQGLALGFLKGTIKKV